MNAVALALSLGLMISAPPEGAVTARVLKSSIHVALVIDGFVPDKKSLSELNKAFGGSRLLMGNLGNGVTLSLDAEEQSTPRRGGAEWRKSRYSEGVHFEVGDIACAEVPIDFTLVGDPTAEKVDAKSYVAFLPAGAYMLDLQVTVLSAPGIDAEFSRERFSSIVSSYTVAVMRRLDWSQYSPGILDTMNEVLRASDPNAALAARLKATPGDAVASFLKAELAREMRVSVDDAIKNFQAAATALEKSKHANTELFLPRLVALDGLALTLQIADKWKEAIPHLEKGLKLATGKHNGMAEVFAYNLARSHARMKNASKACAALKVAIEIDPKNRKAARSDSDFEAIKGDKSFAALLAEPAEK